MLDYLFCPLLELLDVINSEQALLYSYILVVLATAPAWIVAGVQDYKTHEIREELCIYIMALTALHALLFCNILVTLFVGLLACLTFREKEIELVGQADFMLVAHWLTASFTFHSGSGMMLIASIVFLFCIFVYLIVYRDENGKKWKRGKMVPIVPPYAVTVAVMAVCQYPLSRILFFMGW